jgi:sugar phosphate permease
MQKCNGRRIFVLASLLASFVLHLCAGMVDIVPFVFLIFVLSFVAAFMTPAGVPDHSFVTVKLYTQKAE